MTTKTPDWSAKPHWSGMVGTTGTCTSVTSSNTASVLAQICADQLGFIIQTTHTLGVATLTYVDASGTVSVGLHVEVPADDTRINIVPYNGNKGAVA